MKRRHFRYSERLRAAGISEAKQHIIYGITNDAERTAQQDELIKSICHAVAGSDAPGLYRFLTDSRINAVYIHMNYGVEPHNLFRMKREFYKEFIKRQGT